MLLTEMSRGALERDEVIALSLLAAIGGESIFLLGLPGVGKSMVARRLKMAFRDSRCFEYLMSRFSTPDEIFGPVSISKLKDSDVYERVIDGYLPTADVVFLDEIWKAGPAIQNSLLTAINEKIFHNGNRDLSLPVKGIIAASNELPAEGEGLEALWDRFLIRYVVQPIREDSAFERLLSGDMEECSVPEVLKFSGEEFAELQSMIDGVHIDGHILSMLTDLRKYYLDKAAKQKEEQGDDNDEETADIPVPYVSDRRWKKIARLLKTSAILNGRSRVDLSDCLLLEHLIWDNDAQIGDVTSDISQAICKTLMKMASEPSINISGTAVNEFYSPDGGVHYVIDTGNDQLRILASDYEQLGADLRVGRFEGKDKIALCSGQGDFRIRKVRPGTVSINNFTYSLRMTNTVSSSGPTSSHTERGMNDNIDDFISKVEYNLFTRSFREYKTLNTALRQFRRTNVIRGRK